MAARLAPAYFKHEIRHEDQEKQPGYYQEPGGEFHVSLLAGAACKAKANQHLLGEYFLQATQNLAERLVAEHAEPFVSRSRSTVRSWSRTT
jgi:hypothetical protein